MAVKRLVLLPSGWLTVDRSILTYRRGMGSYVDIPVVVALVDTDDGYVLFDTGLDPQGLTDPEGTWGPKRKVVKSFTAEDDIRVRLEQVGLRPGDIRYVVNSHFHWDHTGANRFFPDATFIGQKAEYRLAVHPDDFVAEVYLRRQFDHQLSYRLIDGSEEVVPGVSAVTTYGHTPGHQSIAVNLPKTGPVVLSGDALYTRENIEGMPPGNAWSPPQCVEAIRRLANMVRHVGGQLFITHDPTFWDDHKPFPHMYE